MKHIVACLTFRGNYARAGTLLHSLDENPEFKLDIVVAGSTMLRKYGKLSNVLQNNGLTVSRELHHVVEGGNPIASAKSTGLGIIEFSNIFNELDPDCVITVGDRFETMAITLASAYLNIPIVHLQGGEFSGSIDDKVRHATTKFADYHMVATAQSKDIVQRMGESPSRVWQTGCPSIDMARQVIETSDRIESLQTKFNSVGSGSKIDFSDDYLLVMYYPVTTEYERDDVGDNPPLKSQQGLLYNKTWKLIETIQEFEVPILWFWPNADPGTDQVSKAIREWREQVNPENVRFYINFPPLEFLTLVNNSACIVGNSSVGIRECSFLGQPAVNIGARENLRERAANVIDVPLDPARIRKAIQEQFKIKQYERSNLYGDGYAGKRIAKILADLNFDIKKPMNSSRLGIRQNPVGARNNPEQ